MIPAQDALERLRDGNRRFASGNGGAPARVGPSRRAELLDHQEPFAVVVGCADSRVPVELVFDQGLGDLFVIRVAGNIVAPSQLESVEFAAAHFGPRLVVVLGHSGCGAVKASLAEVWQPPETPARSLRLIVESVRPAIEELLRNEPNLDGAELVKHAGRANIAASVRALREDSEVLTQLIQNEDLQVIGAEYSLETGLVEFIDPVVETTVYRPDGEPT